MDIDAARAYIREHHRAVLATTRSDGRVQMSVVMATVDGDGRVIISSTESAAKVRNLGRRPYAAACVMSDDFFSGWVQVEGRVEVVHMPEALEPLVDYYRSISGEHPNWDEYREAMARDRRVVIRIDIEQVHP